MNAQGDRRTAAARAVRLAVVARRGHLLKVVRRRGGVKVDAEEVLQTALERALAKSDQLRDPARVDAWVGRVVGNALVDALRERRDAGLPVDELELAAADERIGCGCVLVQAGQLKPEYARMLRRVVVEGASVTDVAAELSLTPNNAMVRLHRARKALKARMDEHCRTTSARSCSDCGCRERGCCPQP